MAANVPFAAAHASSGAPLIRYVTRMADVFDWKAWRKAERERLIAERQAVSGIARQEIASRVCASLEAVLNMPPSAVISFYWPFKGELNLRNWIVGLIERGFRSALPVVVEKGRPMIFRLWDPDIRMERGIWNIPVPADTPQVAPDVVIAPLVGFDRAGFRLGYGGGYFDRTLAQFEEQPVTVGVGYAASELPTIFPQPHDLPLQLIVTESAVIRRKLPAHQRC